MSPSVGGGLALALGSAAALNWGFLTQHGAASALPPLSAPAVAAPPVLQPALACRVRGRPGGVGAVRRRARPRAALAGAGDLGRRNRLACLARRANDDGDLVAARVGRRGRRGRRAGAARGLPRRPVDEQPAWVGYRRRDLGCGLACRRRAGAGAIARRSRVRNRGRRPLRSRRRGDEGGGCGRPRGRVRGGRACLSRAGVRRAPARLPARRSARDRRRLDAVHKRAPDRGGDGALPRGPARRCARRAARRGVRLCRRRGGPPC